MQNLPVNLQSLQVSVGNTGGSGDFSMPPLQWLAPEHGSVQSRVDMALDRMGEPAASRSVFEVCKFIQYQLSIATLFLNDQLQPVSFMEACCPDPTSSDCKFAFLKGTRFGVDHALEKVPTEQPEDYDRSRAHLFSSSQVLFGTKQL